MHFAYFDQLRQFWVRNPQRIHATAAEERGEDGVEADWRWRISIPAPGLDFTEQQPAVSCQPVRHPRHGGKIFADQTKNISIFRPVNIGQHKIKPRLAWIRSSSAIK